MYHKMPECPDSPSLHACVPPTRTSRLRMRLAYGRVRRAYAYAPPTRTLRLAHACSSPVPYLLRGAARCAADAAGLDDVRAVGCKVVEEKSSREDESLRTTMRGGATE